MSLPKFFLNEITDKFLRENFKRLTDWFQQDPLTRAQFTFFSIVVPDSTTQTVSHHLGYQPSDVILTAISGGKSVVFNFDQFTGSTISFACSGACTIRFLLGAYKQGSLL